MKIRGKRFHEVTRCVSRRTGALLVFRSDGMILRKGWMCPDLVGWRKFKNLDGGVLTMDRVRGAFPPDRFDYDRARPVLSYTTIRNAASSDKCLGFCVLCGNRQDGCEPDTSGRTCGKCGRPTLYGAEEIIIEGTGLHLRCVEQMEARERGE